MAFHENRLPEVICAGIFDSSFIYPPEQKRTKNRRVSVYEIELPLENTGVSHMDDRCYTIRTDSILCARPGQVRYTELPYKCLFVHFLTEDSYLKALYEKLPELLTVSNRESYESCLNRLAAATVEPTAAGALMVQSKLLELLSYLSKEQTIAKAQSLQKRDNTETIRAAIAYMEANFQEPIGLADIAASVHLSEIYFHNLFHRATGITPHRFLMNKRLSYAKTLLVTTGHSFAEIASLSGFSGQSYFGCLFKKETGCTPREYRMKCAHSWENEDFTHIIKRGT